MRLRNDSTLLGSRGLTLIELMVGLVICAIVVGGTYRLFVSQSRTFTVQDQVVEVQQNLRSAMEIMLRDLRMAGFDDDSTAVPTLFQPSLLPNGDNDITVRYEYNSPPDPPVLRECRYWVVDGTTLTRSEQNTINGVVQPALPPEVILQNPGLTLTFRYGVDDNDDGAMDDPNAWVAAGAINNRKVVSVQVNLSATPEQNAVADVQAMGPRRLVSAVTFRNFSLMR
jgi:prepilin-type N-terminal cleavage/methylation domain-containing protein